MHQDACVGSFQFISSILFKELPCNLKVDVCTYFPVDPLVLCPLMSISPRTIRSDALCSPHFPIQNRFSCPGGAYEFEVMSMPKVCGTPDKPFEVKIVEEESEIPEGKDTPQVCGKDASGCRLAFDLGKSDIKTVAVKENERGSQGLPIDYGEGLPLDRFF